MARKPKHNLLKILKRFLKENREYIKFSFFGQSVLQRFNDHNVYPPYALEAMCREKAAMENLTLSEYLFQNGLTWQNMNFANSAFSSYLRRNGYGCRDVWSDKYSKYKSYLYKRNG